MSTDTRSMVIYGAGGFGRELAWAISRGDQASLVHDVVAFVDDSPGAWGERRNGIEVVSLDDARARWPGARMLVSAGSPKVRQMLAEKASSAGFSFDTFCSGSAETGYGVVLGNGGVVCAKSILTTNITLGAHAQVNLSCTIGHDVVAGAYLTLAPGVHISGCVHLGERVYLGTGSVILNGTQENPLVIADDVVVGAGAVVTQSVLEPGTTVVGVPAKPLRTDRSR